MDKKLMNRNVYKAIKKYDRQQMEGFLKTIYSEGFKDGVESGQRVDFKIELVKILENTKGVGEKTIEKILTTYKERLNKEGQ